MWPVWKVAGRLALIATAKGVKVIDDLAHDAVKAPRRKPRKPREDTGK
jgi:hypothetical protein